MVDAATQTFILEVLDYQQEFTIKLITLSIILTYVISLKIYAHRLELDMAYKAIIKVFGNLFFWPFIVFMPLFTIFLFRGYAAITLWTTLFVLYSIVFGVLFFIFLAYGMEKTLNIFGIKADWNSWNENKLYPEDMKSNLGDFK